jgi:hypothetical protein
MFTGSTLFVGCASPASTDVDEASASTFAFFVDLAGLETGATSSSVSEAFLLDDEARLGGIGNKGDTRRQRLIVRGPRGSVRRTLPHVAWKFNQAKKIAGRRLLFS